MNMKNTLEKKFNEANEEGKAKLIKEVMSLSGSYTCDDQVHLKRLMKPKAQGKDSPNNKASGTVSRKGTK